MRRFSIGELTIAASLVAASSFGACADDGEQVLGEGAVHFGHPVLAVLLGELHQGAGLLESRRWGRRCFRPGTPPRTEL